jgi:hypothetical protein
MTSRRRGGRARLGADRGDQALRAKPAAKPKFVFPAGDQASFLALASLLENTGVGA